MGFEVRALDITTVKCDAIVNSLGVGQSVRVFGRICSDIVKKAGSKMKEDIFSFENEAEPGKIFLTSGYKLPCSHVIHIVTPYFSHDEQLYALEFVYKTALVMAYKKGWKHIALPIIGTGANGYPHSYVLKMVTNLVSAFVEIYKDIKVTVCVPVITPEDYEESFDPKELEKSIKEYFKKNSKLDIRDFEYDSYSFEHLNYSDVEDLLKYSATEVKEIGFRDVCRLNCISNGPMPGSSFLDEKEVLLESGKRPVKFDMNSIGLFSVTNYIETYIDTRFLNESERKIIRKHVNEIVSGSNDSTSLKAKHNNENKRTTITLPMLMRYILALHMTKQEADDLLLFCGKVFSPIGKEDIVYQNIIKLKKYDIYEVNGLCLDKHVEQIFGYAKED